MIDKVLNERYQIIEQIGRGGMAYVYKAKDLKLNRFVAVKVLREEYTENAQFIKKFDRESQAAAGLSHPNIVSVYDVGVQNNIYYIIMEYVDGITLKQYLNKKGHLDYEEATHYVLEVAGALKCAHEHKIIHRDIKPHNILLTKDLTPKVADFGIARAITSSTVTVTNQTMGSVHYISPEQARGGFVDERSDLYSLGIMYYELLTGQLPFDEESSVSIAIKHIQEPLNPPKNLNPEIPDSVNEVVVKLTQKKPEDRYQNAEELIEDLEVILDNSSAALPSRAIQTAPLEGVGTDLFTVEPDTGPYTNPDSLNIEEEYQYDQKKRRRGWIIGGVIVMLLLILGGGYLYNAYFNKQVVVPNVTKLSVADATKLLSQVGLELEVERETYNSEVESGAIISQNPTQGTQVRENTIVKVSVSKGVKSSDVPDVIGESEETANSTLASAGFGVDIQREYNGSYKSGVVFAMDPDPGTTVKEGETVTIYVSKGEDAVTVPGLVGLTQSDAQARLGNNGLNVGTVTQQSSTDYAAGIVIAQSPEEGLSVSRGTYVSFVVSSGPPDVTPPATDPTTPGTTTPSTDPGTTTNPNNNSGTQNTPQTTPATPGTSGNQPAAH